MSLPQAHELATLNRRKSQKKSKNVILFVGWKTKKKATGICGNNIQEVKIKLKWDGEIIEQVSEFK
jgi:hypothetical protein